MLKGAAFPLFNSVVFPSRAHQVNVDRQVLLAPLVCQGALGLKARLGQRERRERRWVTPKQTQKSLLFIFNIVSPLHSGTFLSLICLASVLYYLSFYKRVNWMTVWHSLSNSMAQGERLNKVAHYEHNRGACRCLKYFVKLENWFKLRALMFFFVSCHLHLILYQKSLSVTPSLCYRFVINCNSSVESYMQEDESTLQI